MSENIGVCSNTWCKSHFVFESKFDNDGNLIKPTTCPKCDSFNNELSGGVVWKDKEYDGDRLDGSLHQISYKVKKYY